MTTINDHKKIFDLINSSDLKIDLDFIELPYSVDKLRKLIDLGINGEKIGEVIRIPNPDTLSIKIYNKIDFLSISEKSEQDSNLLIIDIENDEQFSFIKGETFTNFEKSTSNFFFSNINAYLEFQDFLKMQEEKEGEGSFYFVDYYDRTLNKLLFTNLSERGRLFIKHTQVIPVLDIKKDYSKNLVAFKNCFISENKTLPKFLKNAIIANGAKFNSDNKLVEIFESLDEIINDATINFEVYLNNLSIDKIKEGYDELKTKYLSDISGIIGKLTQKIIGLPLALAASLFAASRVTNEPIFLGLLAIAIIGSTIFLAIILSIHYDDLIELKNMFEKKYELLKGNNFFSKNKSKLKEFEVLKDKLSIRVDFLNKKVIIPYFYLVTGSNLIVIGYILHHLKFPFNSVIIGLIIIAFVIQYYKSTLFEKIENS